MKIYLDEGYSFGKGFFETISVKDGRPIDLDKHIARINNSLRIFEIDNFLNEDEVYSYLEKEKKETFALKVIVSDKNKIFTTRKNPYYLQDKFRRISIATSNVLRNSTSNIVNHKSLAICENILELRQAKAKGFSEILFFNEKGNVCEGAVSNIFFITKDEKLLTPKIEDGILPGTVRRKIIENIPTIVRSIDKEEIKNMKGAFLTNSLMEIVQIKNINEMEFCDITKKIKGIRKLLF